MSFDWQANWMTEEHLMFKESTRKFMEAEIAPNADRWEEQGFVDRDFWLKAGSSGLLGASAPAEFGGAEVDQSFDALTIYEQARVGDAGWGFGVHNICVHYLVAFGSDEQKSRWLPGLIAGEIIPAIAMTEPGTGSDLQAVKTTATTDGNEYVINGSKIFITNGQLADLVIVVAKTDKEAGASGVSLIVLEPNAAVGFQRGRNLKKLGMKGQDTSELFFENARVPRENLLGEHEGRGFFQLMNQLGWERLVIAIGAIGAMDGMMRETVAYVRTRKAFGQRLMDFQNTRFKLAEAKTKLEATRSLVNECITKVVGGNLGSVDGAMAKWWGSQMQCEVADECLQLFGGYGYMMEYPIAKAYADARVQKIYGGSNEIQKELIARSLDAD
jgi:acyl-CoA dehydrogenase